MRLGAPQWSYDNLLPYFKRLESWREGEAPHRGDHGPVGITYTCRSDPSGWAVLEAAKAAGYSNSEDINAAEPNGFGLAQSAIDRGRRASAANAYLRPNRGRSNLTVRTRSLATKVLFESKAAVGLQYLSRGTLREVRARREVILTSGALNSPQLLMLSGVGDADALNKLGIAPLQHLPGRRRQSPGPPLDPADAPAHRGGGAVASHAARGPRPLCPGECVRRGQRPGYRIPSGVNAILRTKPDLDAPDVQIMFGAGALEARPWLPGFNDWPDMFYLRPVGSHPNARPGVAGVGESPRQPTHRSVLPLQSERHPGPAQRLPDRARCRSAEIPGSFPWRELSPGPGCISDADVDAHIRATATTVQHASCTCRVGRDELAVVDSQLRVRGLRAPASGGRGPSCPKS